MADETSPAPEAKMLRVYNKSTRRSFTHGAYVLSPSSFLTVPEELGLNWLEGYPKEIVDAGVAQKEIGGAQAEIIALKAKVAALESELAAIKAKGKKSGKDSDLV